METSAAPSLYKGHRFPAEIISQLCLSSEKGTRLPTEKGATEIFLST